MSILAKAIHAAKDFFRTPRKPEERGYAELAKMGGSDWQVSNATEDADIWQNSHALVARIRDLFRTDPLYTAYRETYWANVYGSEGIMLRSTVKEQEDRVIHTPDEEKTIKAFEDRRNRVLEWCATKEGREFKNRQTYLHIREAHGANGTRQERQATVKVGDPDIYARTQIEAAWKEWKRAEFCDIRKSRSYLSLCQLRGMGAISDGDIFIRLIKSPGVNKFGFTTQLINGEYCDRFLNTVLENGNVVRMGIEYQWTPWGMGEKVAYYFIKRQPKDWQYASPGFFGYTGYKEPGRSHDRIPAEYIIHYARPVEAEGTRPAPWVASTIPKARQLSQYELYEVIAAREQAKKVGYLYSDIAPEGGVDAANLPDPRTCSLKPNAGVWAGLPYGVKAQQLDPKHPNGNFPGYRQAMLQSYTSGMIGASYSDLANDYAAINFSAGRLQRLDTQEKIKVLQAFDIGAAEVPIFESFLEMGLTTGIIPLPLSKFKKFNSKQFQGRRWKGVDEVKEATAAALRVANHFSSDPRECAELGTDFEELLFEQAEANMLKERYGINPQKTVETPNVASQITPEDDDTTAGKPAGTEKPKRGRKAKDRLAAAEA